MKRIRTTILTLVLVCAMLAFFAVAHAQQIGRYTPTDHDFGSIALGYSATQVFTVEVLDYGDLTIFTIVLGSDSSDPTYPYLGDSFEITNAPSDGSIISSGTSFEIEVQFSPTTIDEHHAYLWIVTNASNAPYNVITIPLNGEGVESVPDPEEQIEAIIDFFNTSLADGSLVSVGPNTISEKARLDSFLNRLESAQHLTELGDTLGACEEIESAFEKTDGQPIPPDFVGGAAQTELAEMILNLMYSLGCTLPPPPFGEYDFRLVLNANELHPDFLDSYDPFNRMVEVKGNFSEWEKISLTNLGEGIYEFVWSENLGPHDGLLNEGDVVQFVFVIDGVEYKLYDDALEEGVSVYTDYPTPGDFVYEEFFVSPEGVTAFLIGSDPE